MRPNVGFMTQKRNTIPDDGTPLAIGLVGAGAMGGALLNGWIDGGVMDPARSAIFEPAAGADLHALSARVGFALNPPADPSMVGPFDVFVLAVKPQMADEVLPLFRELAVGAHVVSVMAGRSVGSIAALMGAEAKIARAMPNLPAMIGKGVSGLYAADHVDEAGRAMVTRLLAAVGETVWVGSEDALDFVTAISGSGPAYYFLLTEALTQAGIGLGLSRDDAAKLAKGTAIGAGAQMAQDDRDPAALREAVTSPGGTTAAALNVFDGAGEPLRALVKKAAEAAAKRAKELQS